MSFEICAFISSLFSDKLIIANDTTVTANDITDPEIRCRIVDVHDFVEKGMSLIWEVRAKQGKSGVISVSFLVFWKPEIEVTK